VSGGNRPRQSHEWLDTSTDRLRVLWLEGVGTREIGEALGVSKNAVIGKARRLGLAPRPSPLGVHPGQPLPPPRPRPHHAKTQPPPRPKVVLEPQQRASLAGRPPAPPATPPTPPEPPPAPQGSGGTCMYPTSDGRPWTFCGAPCVPGRVYCAEHVAICYHPPGRHRFEATA
jgi:GcrA cell cycle regulator